MKNRIIKIISLTLSAVIIMLILSSCSVSDLLNSSKELPDAVTLKTDLHDAVFSYTYGELGKILPADKLAEIFSEFDELKEDTVVNLSYNDITNKFSENSNEFKSMMDLLTEDEKAQLTNNADEVLAYFVEKINSVKTEKPIVQYNEGFWVDKDESEIDKIKFTQNGELSDQKIEKAAKYFEYFVDKGVGGYFDNEENGKKGTTKKGDNLNDIMYLYGEDIACKLTPENVESVISSLMYDKQKVGDETVVTGITRIIKIVLKDDEPSVMNAFSPKEKQHILEEMKKGSDYFTVDDYDITYNGCVITATFNAATDNILTATYDKNMIIDTDITGVGSLEHIGVQHLSFYCTNWVEYHIGWEQEAE